MSLEVGPFSFNPADCSTLIELLEGRADLHPDKVAFTFLPDGEDRGVRVTYAELREQAMSAANRISQVAAPGDRALMLFPSGLEFVFAFFGCLYSGVIAVPAYPPRRNQNLGRLKAIIDDCAPGVVLTTSKILAIAEPMFAETEGLQALGFVTVEMGAPVAAEDWRAPVVTSDTLAFLQYTSGSTGNPKGVMVSHGNLLYNQAMITEAFQSRADDTVVSWLPLFHDMGLIGTTLHPFYLGATCIFMSPASFLQKPLRWLQAIHDYRGTAICAPNFAYELCANQVTAEQRAELDLSSLRIALSGAEAVRPETLEHFADTFKACGFQRKAFMPTFGLAEATLLVTCARAENRPLFTAVDAAELARNNIVPIADAAAAERATRLVSNGVAPLDSEVVIVDPVSGTELPEGQVGEIWCKGDHIAKGYWRNAEATAETFQAFTETGRGPFMRTGDLGCLLDQELYITGRRKDVIIIRGRNHYPQDIEYTVQQCHVALKADAGAAFSVLVDGEERLVLVQEVERKYRMRLVTEVVSAAIRQAVAEYHELQVHTIVYLKPGAILKTSSGKIQRSANRQAFLEGSLDPIAVDSLDDRQQQVADKQEIEAALELTREQWQVLPAAEREPRLVQYLKAAIATEIGETMDRISDDVSLMGLGIDSLQITQLFTRLRDHFVINLELPALFDARDFRALAATLAHAMEQGGNPLLPALAVVAREELMPMSFSQKRMWFLNRLREGNVAYNLPFALRIQGAFDVEAAEKAFESMIQRHEILRTVYVEREAHAYQQVLPMQPWHFTREDLSYLKVPALDSAIQDCVDAEARKPFDLVTGPVIRTHLVRLPDQEASSLKGRAAEQYLLLVTIHHIAADGFSLKVITDEISRGYEALINDQTIDLPPLPLQYVDFSHWQENLFGSNAVAGQMEYWLEHLNGVPVLDLPLDHPRPPEQSFNGSNYYFSISAPRVQALKKLSRAQGVTLYMTLLSAFKVLLHQYTQSEDICVGTPIANRTMPELEKLIGFFVNTLALRSDLSGNPTFTQLLQRVRKVTQGAFANQEMPFERVVEHLGGPRDMSYSPVFQVMFVLQNSTIDEEFNLAGVNVESLHTAPGTAKFDMTLELSEESGVLRADLEYSTDLFEEETVVRMMAHFQQLIDSILADPEQPLASINMLSQQEREQLLVEFNATDADYPLDDSIHGLFEQTAAARPEAEALVVGTQRIDYGQLNQRSNQLARYLAAMQVGPGTLVGVCMERNADMVVALLAILKAGAAYVPIDPNYPADRVAYMLQDSAAPVVLTQRSLAAMLPPAKAEFTPVFVDEIAQQLAQQPGTNLAVAASGDALAYVIYTSGSTGLPKGVMISHGNATALIHWAREVYSSEQINGVLAATSICFDLSVYELFFTLCSGGKVILAENVLALPDLPAVAEVVLINTVPSAIATLLHNDSIPPGVQVINLAGEALSCSLVDSLYQNTRVQQVYDLYGPSEDTTYSTFTQRQPGKSATIGRPISNTRAYILNQNGALVAPGLVGELYLAGTGVTHGYRNRADLTAERYLPNPFSTDPRFARMYRTGDLVSYRDDGNLVYQGRIDHQVKVRGFRIELGEIQSVINGVDGVVDSLVLTRPDALGNPCLVAYVVAAAGLEDVQRPALLDAVRGAIRARLPEYMLPSAFLLLDRFPLTPNGKIDRAALPAPSMEDLVGAGFVAPRTDQEEAMAAIWCSVLKLEQVGVTNNFFELGGHSLLATQCMARIRDQFDVDLPVKLMFSHPTIAELCEQLELVERRGDLLPPPVEILDRDGELPPSFAQMRIWFVNQLEESGSEHNMSTSYNMPAAIRLRGKLNVTALRKAFQQLVVRHEVLRTSFLIDNGRASQLVREADDWFMDVRDLRHLDWEEREAEVIRFAEDEATRSFDLILGPQDKARRLRLMRTRLLQTGEQEHVLLLTMHHIISDGWSLGILIAEVGELYRALVSGELPLLEPITVQYADYASWQRKWMEGPVLEHQLSYWRQQLAGVPVLELPTDRPRPAVMTFNGDYEPVRLSVELTQQLNILSRKQGVTLYMTLLSAFYALLYRYTGQTDLCVGTPVANRVRPEFEKLIGCFVNSLALRVDVENDPRFVDLLAQVQEVTLAAYSHQDLPFEKLVEALGVARDRSHSPLFQVVFTLQNASQTLNLAIPGLELEMLPSVAKSAKFDLTLNLEEGKNGLEGMIEYNSDLFERETVHRMIGHLESMLEAVVQHPGLRLSEVPLLSEHEQDLILDSWNHQAQEYAWEDTIHGRFEAMVAAFPQRAAISLGEQCLSYAELNGRANQLAHYLMAQGVQPNDLVGICLDRNVDMVVAILAVLKAGAAYVPLDPTNPEERLRFILEDAGVALLVTEVAVQDSIPAGSFRALVLDHLRHELQTQADGNPQTSAGPDDRAYVIYTSGTTGKPKGVLIPHSNVIRLFSATDQWFAFDENDVWTLFHSVAFDFAVWELWGALFHGGRVVVVPTQVARSTEDFYDLVCAQGVTVLNQTPSAFTQFIRVDEFLRSTAGRTTQSLALRYVIFGGEALDFAALQTWSNYHGLQRPQLINMYGITETTVHVTYHRITTDDLHRRQSLIGRPIPDLDLYILDQHMNPVPIGVPGELHVGGQGLAQGYLNRSDLTDQRFVTNPFAVRLPRAQGLYQRLYKTGDLGRYHANGVVEYLGRLDDQVKIRGYRIELGEIESTISGFPAVREAVVLAREDIPGDKRLVAYVLSDGDIVSNELKAYLSKQLPDYMVPRIYMVLPQFPLTANGKVDRRNLPVPEDGNVRVGEYVAPRNETEAMLVEIWQQVLGQERIGVMDNFFDLGGHSLLATQVVSRIREQFHVELPLSSLFEDPTIENIALNLLHAELESADDLELAELLGEIEGLTEEDLKNL